MGMLYIKKGRKYHAVRPFTGFPADGIWLVSRDRLSSTCIVRVGDESPPMSILPFAAKKDECCQYIQKKAKEKGAYSMMDMAEWSSEFWASCADEQLPKPERSW